MNGTRPRSRPAICPARPSSTCASRAPPRSSTIRESTDRQYALAAKARELGWPNDRIIVIDEDLGLLGSGFVARSGFAPPHQANKRVLVAEGLLFLLMLALALVIGLKFLYFDGRVRQGKGPRSSRSMDCCWQRSFRMPPRLMRPRSPLMRPAARPMKQSIQLSGAGATQAPAPTNGGEGPGRG